MINPNKVSKAISSRDKVENVIIECWANRHKSWMSNYFAFSPAPFLEIEKDLREFSAAYAPFRVAMGSPELCHMPVYIFECEDGKTGFLRQKDTNGLGFMKDLYSNEIHFNETKFDFDKIVDHSTVDLELLFTTAPVCQFWVMLLEKLNSESRQCFGKSNGSQLIRSWVRDEEKEVPSELFLC